MKKKYFPIFNIEELDRKPWFKRRDLVRTAASKKLFSKRGSTEWLYNIYTRTEVKHDTNPSYRITFSAETYNQNLFRPTELTVDEINQVMKDINLIQRKH